MNPCVTLRRKNVLAALQFGCELPSPPRASDMHNFADATLPSSVHNSTSLRSLRNHCSYALVGYLLLRSACFFFPARKRVADSGYTSVSTHRFATSRLINNEISDSVFSAAKYTRMIHINHKCFNHTISPSIQFFALSVNPSVL